MRKRWLLWGSAGKGLDEGAENGSLFSFSRLLNSLPFE